MAKRTTVDPENDAAIDGKEVDPIADALDAIGDLSGSGQTYNVRLYRVRPDTTVAYVGKQIPLAGFSMDLVAEQWGGGRYRIDVVNVSNQVERRAFFEIDPSVKPAARVDPSQPREIVGEQRSAALADTEPAWAKSLRERLERQEAKPRVGFVEVAALVTSITPLATAFLTRKSDVGVKDLLTIMAARSPASEALETAKMIREEAERMNGGAGGGGDAGGGGASAWASLAEKALDFMAKQQIAAPPMVAHAANALPAAPAPAVAPVANPGPVAAPVAQTTGRHRLAEGLAQVAGFLRTGVPPHLLAAEMDKSLAEAGMPTDLIACAEPDDIVAWFHKASEAMKAADIQPQVVELAEAWHKAWADDEVEESGVAGKVGAA